MAMNEYPTQSKTTDGDYFVAIDGLPMSYTWKKLKDLARKEAPNLGWTELRYEAKDRGWIRVNRQNEAYNLYDFFKRNPIPNRQLRVFLWLTATSPPELLACNEPVPPQLCNPSYDYTSVIPQTSWAATQTEWSAAPRFLPIQTSSQRMPTQQLRPLQPTNLLSPRKQMPPSSHYPSNFQALPNLPQARHPRQPAYILSNGNGLPINVSAGCVTTESRGIFIGGLHFSTTQQKLESHLNTAGLLEACEIQINTAGSSRGYAFAKFASREAAINAVRLFNGTQIDGKTILVRLDKESDTLGSRQSNTRVKRKQNGVVIANGSTEKSETTST